MLFSAGHVFLPLGHVDKCVFCLFIAVSHKGFMFSVVADSRVPQFAGIHRISFS